MYENQTQAQGSGMANRTASVVKTGLIERVEVLSKGIQETHVLMERLESRLAPIYPQVAEKDSGCPVRPRVLESPVGSQIEMHIEGVEALQGRIQKLLNTIEL